MLKASLVAQFEAMKQRQQGMQAAMREIQVVSGQLKQKIDMTASADGLHEVKEAFSNYAPMHEFKALERNLIQSYQRTDLATEQNKRLEASLLEGVSQISDKIGSKQLNDAIQDLQMQIDSNFTTAVNNQEYQEYKKVTDKRLLELENTLEYVRQK